jgi:hypothetical protein
MDNEEAALKDRFTLFFDFLGTSDAAQRWPRDRVHKLVDLLISVSHVQATEVIVGEPQEDGGYKLIVTPEITTFSDNVVVSYRGADIENGPNIIEMGEPHRVLKSLWASIVCKDAIRILSGVAEMGLRIGMLIRGGLSFGQLYHDGDVVFGEAMVDAYRLESKLAKNPRVLVSERVINQLTDERPEDVNYLLRDTDGQWHLNYFRQMASHAIPSGPAAFDGAIRWRQAHLRLIDQNIEELRRSSQGRAAKWEWFRERFEHATSRSQEWGGEPPPQ